MSDAVSPGTGASASVEAHRASAPDALRCAVLTVSDTRSQATDKSGALIQELLGREGHAVVDYRIIPDEPDRIRETLATWAERGDVDAILTNGGTGVAARDTTYDVIAALLDKRLDGFGELFRMLSFAEIGAAAMLSRATAGIYRGRVLIAMPGSTNAVRLAMEKLIVPELAHIVYEVRK